MAVTVVLALMVTVQVTVVEVVQSDQEEKVLEPLVAGAVRVMAVPELYVRVKGVVPLAEAELSAGETVMATPEVGVAESMVRV